jgi:hypothetical protein
MRTARDSRFCLRRMVPARGFQFKIQKCLGHATLLFLSVSRLK